MDDQGFEYAFSAKIWYCGWHLVSLPKEMAKEIRENFKCFEEGWGRLKVLAKIGNSEWKTAVWFDTKQQTYLLPIKSEIRKKEKTGADHTVDIALWISCLHLCAVPQNHANPQRRLH